MHQIGSINSPIIEQIYQNATFADDNNVRISHAATNQMPDSIPPPNYSPFGNANYINSNLQYENPGNAAIPVSDPTNPTQIIEGYGSDGQANVFINAPETSYPFKYSTTDKEGATGRGIGNIPATVIAELTKPPPEQTSINSRFFDPRAYVIFQDASKENALDPPNINKQHFISIGYEYDRFGNLLTSESKSPITGNFIRSEFNPRNNTITYYYFDSSNSKWIISKQPYDPTTNPTAILASKFISKPKGSAGYVFEWRVGGERNLF